MTTTEMQPAPDPGVYSDIPGEVYHAWNAGVLSKSRLWSMVTGIDRDGNLELNPAKFVYERENPRPTTPAMVEGDALDCLLLEPHEFDQRFVMAQSCSAPKKKGSDEVCGAPGKVLVDGEWRCGTHGRGGEAVPPDKTLLDHIQMTKVRGMARSVREHPEAWQLVNGASDQQMAVVGELFGRPFKGRFDIFHGVDSGLIVDMKRSHYHAPHMLHKHAVNMGWHVQMAIYYGLALQHDHITEDATIKLLIVGDKSIFGAGKEAVYPVEIYTVSDEMLLLGERHLGQLVDAYNDCELLGEWPNPVRPERVLEPPRWIDMDFGGDDE